MKSLPHKPTLQERLDLACRNHPRLLLAGVVLLGITATILILSSPKAPVILYQAF